MNNDNINIRVKYIPDTTELRNIKELKAPEIKIGGKNVGKNIFESYNAAVRDLNKEMSKGANASTMLKGFKNIEAEASKAKIQINNMIDAINKSFQSPGNQALIKDYENLIKQSKKLEEESKKRRTKTSELSQYKSQTKMSTPQARKEISKADALVAAGEKLTKQDQERLDIAKQIVAKEEELAKLRTQEEIRSAQRDVKSQMEDPRFASVVTAEGAISATNELTEAYNKFSIEESKANINTKQLTNQLDKQEKTVKSAKEEVLKMGDVISGTFLGTTLSRLFETGLNKGVQFFKEYDEILTRTMMVTGQSREEVNNLTASYNELANQLSSTTKDVAAAQLVFYQQGLGTSEALKMTEASIAISKTGGIEAAEAADRLTAAVRGYQLSANEAMDIADKMSALDAAAASSVDELTVAMQKSASQARMAGLDLDYYMAYLSTMQEVTREAPENIGTAMKSITSRLQEIKDIGKVSEDDTTFSNVAKALNSIGIAAVDSSGQLRNLQEIMDELGPLWNTLDRNHKAYIATVLAGNRQQSRFIALMDNYDRAMELVSVSQNSAGEHSKQLRAYNTGLEASFEKLTNAWQQFATRITDSSAIIGLVNNVTKLIEKINSLPQPLIQVAAGFWALNKAVKAYSAIKMVDWGKEIGKAFGLGNIDDDKIKIEGLGDKIKKLGSTFKSVVAERKKFNEAIKEGKEISDVDTVSTDANTSAVERNNTVKLEKQALMKGNNSIKNEEINENNDLTNSQKTLKTAIEGTTEALKEQDRVYSENGTGKLSELEAIQHRTKAELKGLQRTRTRTVQENKSVIAQWKQQEAEARQAYESAVNIDNLRKEAEKQLLEEGVLSGSQTSMFSDMFFSKKDEKLIQQRMDTINKRLRIGYHEYLEEIRDRAMAIVMPNNALVDSIDQQMEALKKRLEEGAARITKLRKENEKKNQEEGKKFPKKTRQGTPKTPSEDDTLGQTKGGLGEVKSAIIGAFSTGVVISMIGQVVGLNEELSNSIGLVGGFIKAGYQLGGVFGAISGTIIGVGTAIIQHLYPSLDKVQERLDEILRKKDELDQKYSDLESSLKTYEELSRKLQRSDEETQELTDSTQALAKALPQAVEGYDNLGNAIINTSVALEALNKIADQRKELAGQTFEQYSDMQKAEASSKKIKGVGKVIAGITAAIVGITSVLAAIPTGGASLAAAATALTSIAGVVSVAGVSVAAWGAYDIATAKEQGEENARILQENYADIYSQMQDFVEQTIKNGDPQYEKLRQQFANQINSTLLSGAISSESDAKKLLNNLKIYYDKLGTTGLTSIAKILEETSGNVDLENISYNELKSNLEAQLSKTLKSFNLSDEEIDLALDGAINVIWQGIIDVSNLQKKIRNSIKDKRNYGNLTEDEYTETANQLANDLGNLNPQIISMLNSVGLLDTRFVEMYRNAIGGQKQLTDMFIDNGGRINKEIGAVNLLNAAYKSLKTTSVNTDEIKAKREELEKQRQAILQTTPEASEGITSSNYTRKELVKQNRQGVNYQETLKAKASYQLLTKQIEEYDAQIKNATADSEFMTQRISQIVSLLDDWDVPTFSEIADSVDKAISEISALDDTIQSLEKTGGKITLDQFTELFNMLDSLEEAMYVDQGSMDMYGAAFERLANSIQFVNGELTIQADGVKAIAEVKAAAFQADMKRQSAEIQGEIDKVEMQRALIDEQIKALEAGVEAAENGGNATEAIEKSLNSGLETVFNGRLDEQAQYAAASLTISNQLLQKTVDVFSKLKKAMAGETVDVTDITPNIIADFKQQIKDKTQALARDKEGDFDVEAAKKQIAALRTQYKNLGNTINVLKSKQKVVNDLSKMDTSALAAFGNREAQDNADEYIGKLKITFSLLQQIERLQHQININSRRQNLYKDVNGSKYADSLITELNLMQDQYDLRKKLFEMQQKELGKQMGRIQDSPFASLFSFAENGLIQLDWDAYWAMPGEMQEEVDALVDEYENLQKEVEDTEQVLYDYADAIKDTWTEVEDTIINAENTIVDAIKNREKILHDARQKALDDEIDMIEKAVEARNAAREKENQGKELYKAQEALRRATLDSSGKNNAQLLQLQQDLEDKQLEIADKRFEEDMNDRKQWLQDTKDAETETYEYRLETMTKFWEEAQEIMNSGTENIMNFLILWDEKYRTESEISRDKTRRGWETMYEQIQELYDKGFDLTTFHLQLDSVTKDLENQKIKVDAIATAWKSVAKAAQRASSYTGAGNYSSKLTTKYPPKKDDEFPDADGDKKKQSLQLLDNVFGKSGKKVKSGKKGEEIEFNDLTVYSKMWNGQDAYKDTQGYYWPLSAFYFGPWKKAEPLNNWDIITGTKKYATGGMVDYTGPAWVDGTKTKPEAFLNAYQTEQIGALAKTLDTSTINNATANSTVTFGSINFNVASMSSAADGRKALDIFVQGANDMMAKKGIGTKLNLNVK